MTPITHKIEETGVELCFVPLPKEKVDKITVDTFSNKLKFVKHPYSSFTVLSIPHGKCKLLYLYSELTEENLEGLMPTKRIKKAWDDTLTNMYIDLTKTLHYFDTALEGFNSLMQHLKLYMVNPYGEKPTPCYGVIWDQDGDDELDQWQEAQQRTHADYAILIRKIGN